MAEALSESAAKPVVVAARHVRLVRELVRVGLAQLGANQGEKRVELIRERDVIQAVEVTCSCGERTVLHCDYK